ncbi:MAG: CsbD family protein [Sulfuriferula sp.]
MNKNQIQGTTKDIVGKVQEKAGKLVGNEEQQVEGLDKQISGKVQKAVGDVQEVITKKVNSI